MRVSSDMPDDVRILHDALEKIREVYGVPDSLPSGRVGVSLTLNLKNCGTALRFLRVHLQMCYPGEPIVLEGDPRLMERDGKPTSQTTSALILHGVEVPVEPNESPYITMSRRIKDSYSELRERSYSEAVLQRSGLTGVAGPTAKRSYSEAVRQSGCFDMVFIDADKRQYCEYLELVAPLVREGGFILADNTLWDGHIIDPAYDRDAQTLGLRRFNEQLAADNRFEQVILPLRDGLTIIRKKEP